MREMSNSPILNPFDGFINELCCQMDSINKDLFCPKCQLRFLYTLVSHVGRPLDEVHERSKENRTGISE